MMRLLAAASLLGVLALAGCSDGGGPIEPTPTRGDFRVEAHNNSTFPGRFTFRLSEDNRTRFSESKEVAGGATLEWVQPFEDGHAYQFEITYGTLTGGTAGMNGQLRPTDCRDGEALLRLQGEFLASGEPSFGAGGELLCHGQHLARF